ncbi:MAG: hypothetical protein JST26_05835 [Bacteroidetes bacterium]|nr:hypothetical protein [Bacteroidota bacterium]
MEDQELAIQWQQKGHNTKRSIIKQLTNFAVATIGFATSVLLLNNEKVPIISNELSRCWFFKAIILVFIALSIFLAEFFVLMRIEFSYSEALGTDENVRTWKHVDKWHLIFYWVLAFAILIYISSLAAFFLAVLNAL